MVHVVEMDDSYLAPAYAGRLGHAPVPKHRMPDGSAAPEAVYRLIHDELLLDGSSRLNMATFVTTWMDPEAERLMAETFDKNMIDKDEYPQTAEIERRCVNIVAELFEGSRTSSSSHRRTRPKRASPTRDRQRSGAFERLGEVGDEIGAVLDPHRQPDQVVRHLERRTGGGGVGHRSRVLDQALDRAQ